MSRALNSLTDLNSGIVFTIVTPFGTTNSKSSRSGGRSPSFSKSNFKRLYLPFPSGRAAFLSGTFNVLSGWL